MSKWCSLEQVRVRSNQVRRPVCWRGGGMVGGGGR
jgi:hypothetical protein